MSGGSLRRRHPDNPSSCDKCGGFSYVSNTHHPEDNPTVIVRRRHCVDCKAKWWTIEVRGMRDYKAKTWDAWF
jgi:transcriptional regulator NrdR family protein